jgi:putative hydrolase of the HAD superfamily
MVFENEKSHEATIGLISDIELWNWIYKQFKLSPEDGLLFRKEFFAGDRMDWELLKYIDHLRPAYSTGLLSNAWMDARQSLGTKYPGWDVFDYIFFSAEIHLMKPDPQIYQYATKAMKVLPKETIFVDDQPENVEAADRFGIHAICFQNSEQAIRDVSQLLNS